MFSLEQRSRTVELYFTTPMTNPSGGAHGRYQTHQRLERWPAAGRMDNPIVPLKTRQNVIDLALGGI